MESRPRSGLSQGKVTNEARKFAVGRLWRAFLDLEKTDFILSKVQSHWGISRQE